MDYFNQLAEDVPWLDILIFILSIGLVLTVFNYIVLNDSNEQPVAFDVPIPEQCGPQWKGEVLDRPSIKVFASHHSMSLQKGSLATGVGFKRYTVLLPVQWTPTRLREPFYT